MSGAGVAALVLILLLGAALAYCVLQLRAMRTRLRDAEARRDIAAALASGDVVRGTESALAVICDMVGAGVALLVVSAGEGDIGVRARHVADGVPEPLHGLDLDDTEIGALDAVAGRGLMLVPGPEEEARLSRFAAAAGLRSTAAIAIGEPGSPVRGILALADPTRRLDPGARLTFAAAAAQLSEALEDDAPLRRALRQYVDVRHKDDAEKLHDPLTHLPTRAILLDALQDALDHREPDRPVALLMIRLGGLLAAVERLGPLAGGAVLGEIGSRLAVLLRHTDMAARVGESEFALLLRDLRDTDEAAIVARRVHEGLARPVVVGDVALDSNAAIGVRIIGAQESTTLALVLRDVATALTAAQGNPDGYCIFDQSMAASDTEELLTDLREAIQDNALALHFQPIIDLRDGAILGAEALLRWFHPSRGAVAPMDFLPLAAQAGLASELGNWVLRNAANQLNAWQDRFKCHPPLALCVNIGADQLGESAFTTDVLRILHETATDPERVILEFSEEVLQARLNDAGSILDPLQRAGVHLAVDDVGTGHATLEYLRRMPVDILKIGRPFIAALVDGDPGSSTAHAIVAQGGKLRMSLVAEGVETALQVTRLRDLGCTMAQGFHLSRPLDAAGMDALLATGHVELGDMPPLSPLSPAAAS